MKKKQKLKDLFKRSKERKCCHCIGMAMRWDDRCDKCKWRNYNGGDKLK